MSNYFRFTSFNQDCHTAYFQLHHLTAHICNPYTSYYNPELIMIKHSKMPVISYQKSMLLAE